MTLVSTCFSIYLFMTELSFFNLSFKLHSATISQLEAIEFLLNSSFGSSQDDANQELGKSDTHPRGSRDLGSLEHIFGEMLLQRAETSCHHPLQLRHMPSKGIHRLSPQNGWRSKHCTSKTTFPKPGSLRSCCWVQKAIERSLNKVMSKQERWEICQLRYHRDHQIDPVERIGFGESFEPQMLTSQPYRRSTLVATQFCKYSGHRRA